MCISTILILDKNARALDLDSARLMERRDGERS